MVARGPRESVTLEGRCIARLREYLVAGADSRPQGVSELTVALDPYVRARQRREGESTVVGFYSPTGWNTEAIDLVSGRNGTSPFVHSSVSLCLIGPGVADLHGNGADGRLAQFIPCFGGSTEQEMVLECKTELHTTLLIDGQVPLARFARGKGFDEMVVQLACAALLREEPDTEIANLRSVGRVLRRKEDK